MPSNRAVYHKLPGLVVRSPSSYIVDDLDALERWLLHRRWIIRRAVNSLERCRFTKASGQLLLLYKGGTVSISGQHQDATRAELAKLEVSHDSA